MPLKYNLIAETIKQDITKGLYNQTMLLPTEQVLCDKFNVSRQTIRKALSILVSDGLIEKRQGSGSHICGVCGESCCVTRKSVAVITSYISDYIFPSILREIENIFSLNNITPLLFATQNQVSTERRILENLLSLDKIDGILVEGTKTSLPNPNLDLYKKLINKNIPIVFLHNKYYELSECLCVVDDNYAGGKMLVEYLYKNGHKKIAGIFKSDDIQGHERYSGYVETLRDLNLPFSDEQVFWYNTEFKNKFIDDNTGIDLILNTIKNCSAVICYNDEIAGKIINNASRIGIKIPNDLSVVSFDNSQYSELSIPRITSLSHGIHNIGRMSAKLIVKILKGEKCDNEVADWILVEKESSKLNY